MTAWLDRVVIRLGYVAAAVIILAALLVSMGRLLTPVLNDHLTQFEAWSSQVLQVPVKIGHVTISWDYYEPELSIRDVVFLDKHDRQPKMAIQKITVNLSIFRSLLTRQLLPESIKVTGVHLTINQVASRRFDIEELKELSVLDQVTGAPTNLNDVFALIFTQPNLALEDIDITYHTLEGESHAVILNKLELYNSSDTHKLIGDAILNQEMPLHALIDLNWKGSITDLQHVSGELYLYLKGVSLPQWIAKKSWQNLQIKQGLGSSKVWAKWDNNQWQEIQSQLQFYNLEIQSLVTNKVQHISRLNGHFGWRRDGDKQIFAGDDIFIDLPKHLWPNTDFKLITIPSTDGSYKLQQVNIGYFNALDIQQIALASGLLPEAYQKIIVALNPRGEIYRFTCSLPNGSLADMANNEFSAQFANLSLNAWDKYPGVNHFNGSFAWSAKAGNVSLNCARSSIILDSIFANPVMLNRLVGDVRVKKEDDGAWNINAKNLQANSEDIKITSNMNLMLPVNNSPVIDLSTDFTVFHTEKISNYLPLKLFDPTLMEWLRHAFSSGQIESGKGMMQGRLADYPFTKGNGKFLVTGTLKNVDLTYDSDWPAIRRINGVLTFADDAMRLDVDSSEVVGAPLTQVHAAIPNLSAVDPLILSVTGKLHADLSQGMRFIQTSPLKKSIGANLSRLRMSGPMQLNLALTIPLKNADATKVQGDAKLENAKLNVKEWDLTFDDLKGALHFTEQDIHSDKLEGRLLGEVATLQLRTHYEGKNATYLQAIIQSMVSVPELESWLKTSLSQVVEGAAAYQAELRLPTHDSTQQTQILLNSNLKGILINLPSPYGKTAIEERNLQGEVTLGLRPPVLVTLHYSDLLSAAIGFQQDQQGLQFVGGELRLGNGDAKYAGQNGLIVAAQFKQLDWQAIQPYYEWITANNSNQSAQVPSLHLPPGLFRGVNVQADSASLFGLHLDKAKIQVTKESSNWLVNVDSKQLAGTLRVDANFSSIHGRLKRFYFTSTNEQQKMIDPKTLPALSLSIGDLSYENKNLGQVSLSTTPSRNGLIIREFQMQSSLSQLSASGYWQSVKGGYSSHLQGSFATNRLSDMLRQWGLASKGLIGSNGSAQFDLTWADAPYKPTFVGLSGDLKLQLGEGRIVNLGNSTDAKIGIGRLLNLLSLQSIPRRLTLNFSDLSEQGYAFDVMQGSFNLRSGNAYTSNTYFNGQIARVDISGRIGLLSKDYDMTLSITPYITSSLPLVATIATGGNPIVGAAAWMVDKVVGRAVSQLTTYRYKITGSWDNPNWEQGASAKAR